MITQWFPNVVVDYVNVMLVGVGNKRHKIDRGAIRKHVTSSAKKNKNSLNKLPNYLIHYLTTIFLT